MPLQVIFFNAAGFIISVSAIIMIARASVVLSQSYRKNALFILKALLLVSMSFLYSIFLGQFVGVTQVLTIQSIILALGVSTLVYSANKLFEMYERSKSIKESAKEDGGTGLAETSIKEDVADVIETMRDAVNADFDGEENKEKMEIEVGEGAQK